jgi:ATP-dependent RNA helicase DeaD
MRQQLKSLKEGVHIVVATPGRLLDHLKRGSADFSQIKTVVLDEADEMLRMGFIDDVDQILAQTPKGRRVALFSATMPPRIREIASEHLDNPVEIAITSGATTNVNIDQYYWLVKGTNKLDALARFLGVENTQGVIVFVRTRESTSAIAEQLRQRGFNAAPLNGDIDQKTRIKTVEQLKSGRVDIIVATDVAARGLDVERITHVINYDIPFDRESYVHRIGRTGRAGREGKAILFVAPRERRMLSNIERVTKQKIQQIELPSLADIDAKARARLIDQLKSGMSRPAHPRANEAIEQLINEGHTHRDISMALATMLIDGIDPAAEPNKAKTTSEAGVSRHTKDTAPAPTKDKKGQERKVPLTYTAKELGRATPLEDHPDVVMERFWLAIGRDKGVKPREIMGAVANEVGIEGQFIGKVNIFEHYSTVDLPEGMPKQILKHLKKVRVKGANLGAVRVVDSLSA